MPCRSDYMEPTDGELKQTKDVREKLEELGNRATYSNDVLREYLLGNKTEREILKHVGQEYEFDGEFEKLTAKNSKLFVRVPEKTVQQVYGLLNEYSALNDLASRMEPPTKKQLAIIERKQIAHRKADLARLLKTLGAAGDVEKLRKVLDADPLKPLEPQLGFSPDEY